MAATPTWQRPGWGTAGRADDGFREWSEDGGAGRNGSSPGLAAGDVAQMAKALGWFSLGLGLAQVAMPRQVSTLIGLRGDEDDQKIMRVVGMREIASGLGILAQAKPTPWLWSRVGGDAMDLALLRSAMDSPWSQKDRVTAAALAVLGITAADVLCSTKITAEPDQPDQAMQSNEVHVTAAVTVQAPVSKIFALWDGFQGLPRFMSDAATVQITGNRQSRWTVPGPAGTSLEWVVQITDVVPNEQIRWQTVDGGLFSAEGTVRFRTAPGNRGTQVIFDAHFSPPGGALGQKVAQPLAEIVKVKIGNDLRRFKQLIELGEVVHSDDSIVPGPNPAQPQPRTPAGHAPSVAA